MEDTVVYDSLPIEHMKNNLISTWN